MQYSDSNHKGGTMRMTLKQLSSTAALSQSHLACPKWGRHNCHRHRGGSEESPSQKSKTPNSTTWSKSCRLKNTKDFKTQNGAEGDSRETEKRKSWRILFKCKTCGSYNGSQRNTWRTRSEDLKSIESRRSHLRIHRSVKNITIAKRERDMATLACNYTLRFDIWVFNNV